MIPRVLAALALVALFGCSSSDGPILVGQGTGESEYSLAFARANLIELLKTCSGVCPFDANQTEFLNSIIDTAPAAPIAFYEISKFPDRFRFVDSGFRKVIFNHRRLWQDEAGTVPFDIPYAVSVWVDVLMFKSRFIKSVASKESVKSGLITALRQRILRVDANFQQSTPFVAMTWKGKESDRLYIRNRGFENIELTARLASSLGCDSGLATGLVVNSVRFSDVIENEEKGLSVRMETSQNFKCGEEARRSRAKILFRTAKPDEGGVYTANEESFKIFAEGE